MVACQARSLRGQGTEVVNEDMSNADPPSAAFDTFFFSTDDSDGNLFVEATYDSSGGNPNDRLIIDHFHDPVPAPDGNPFGYEIQSVHVYTLFSYTPSVDGPIESISFTIDVENSGPDMELFFTVSDSFGGSIAGFQTLPATAGFETLSVVDLTNAEFPSRDFAGSEPLFFGFGFISVSFNDGDDDFEGEQFSVAFDNFRVSIQAIPEPAGAGFAVLLASLWPLHRRRRRTG